MCSGLARIMTAIWFSGGGVRAVIPGGWDPRKREGRRGESRGTLRQRHARKKPTDGRDRRKKQRERELDQARSRTRTHDDAVARISVRGKSSRMRGYSSFYEGISHPFSASVYCHIPGSCQ
ncbi:hypothetical protein BC826DRAFT_1030810 [Russula brevipes]|nr:hypothetical protein BC826DRAFT_1030810 [Russula brevipes]